MPVVLSDADLNELNALMRDFRHAEASALIQFINKRVQAQQKTTETKPPLPGLPAGKKGNGKHAEPA